MGEIREAANKGVIESGWVTATASSVALGQSLAHIGYLVPLLVRGGLHAECAVFDALVDSFETKTRLSIERIPNGGTRAIWRSSVRSSTPLFAMIAKSIVQ